MKMIFGNPDKRIYMNSQIIYFVFFVFSYSFRFFTNGQQLYTGPNNPKISQALKFENRDLANSEIIKIWVFFTDKGILNQRDFQDAIHYPERLVSKRSLQRRKIMKETNNLVDFQDLHVNKEYISAVSKRVEKWCTTSRWLNAVSVEANLIQIANHEKLPFVRKIQPVSRIRAKRKKVSIQFQNPGINPEYLQDHLIDYGASIKYCQCPGCS